MSDWRASLVKITYEELSTIDGKWWWTVIRRTKGEDADATLSSLRSRPATIRSVFAEPEV
jgi:hypothetical protein